jgi:hypothetical protein
MPLRRIRNFISDTASALFGSGDGADAADTSDEVAVVADTMDYEVVGEGAYHFPYVVRGARIFCPFGTHIRKLDMTKSHGAFIRGKAMMNEADCVVGLSYNIAPFGGCHSPNNTQKQIDITVGVDDELMPTGMDEETGGLIRPSPGTTIKARLCIPTLLGNRWLEAEENTLVDGKPALTVKCSILCVYACGSPEDSGITFLDDGQGV